MLTTMGIVARRHEWPLEGARASVEKHMVTSPIRRIGKLVVDLRMPSGIPTDARPILERSAHTCPVEKSLHPDVDLDITNMRGETSLGAGRVELRAGADRPAGLGRPVGEFFKR